MDMTERECALLDYHKGTYKVNWKMIRTTAIDGFSERIRFGVAKPIRNNVLKKFLLDAAASDATPHIVRIFNIIGFPTETHDDWEELIDVFRQADAECTGTSNGKKWVYGLQNNHFIPYPATPMACAPFTRKNFRGAMRRELGINLPKSRLHEGKFIDLVESSNIEALSIVLLNLIVARGGREDSENIIKIARSKKFWRSLSIVKENTLAKYFDLDTLCGAYSPENLPSRYLHTYANVEKLYGRTALERGG